MLRRVLKFNSNSNFSPIHFHHSKVLKPINKFKSPFSNEMSSATQNIQDSPTTTSTFTSAQEERKWNNVRSVFLSNERSGRNFDSKLSEKMSSFHDWFKEEFDTLYELADGSFSRRGLSLSLYLDTARSLSHHLTMHHTIEERFLFPVLGKTMPQFSVNDNGAHLESHHGIHIGLDQLDTLVKKWKNAPSDYSPEEMRACLDSFREVLFHHLDEEVADLRGENLKKYITLHVLESSPI